MIGISVIVTGKMERNITVAELTLESGALDNRFPSNTYHLFSNGHWQSSNKDLNALENHPKFDEESLIVLQVKNGQ